MLEPCGCTVSSPTSCTLVPPALRVALQGLPQLPWPPLLTEEEVQRGTTYYGSGNRLRRVAKKLLAAQPIKVFMLGGSVTAGGGAVVHPDNEFADRLFQFINSSFPHR